MAKCYAKDVVKIAQGEIGVKESPANSNMQKYGKEYGANGTAWCCQFVWWVFKHAGASELFYGGKKTAYCPTLMNYYKKQGQFFTKDFKAGDIIFFDFNGNNQPDHVGIVERVSGSTVYTIEGNTSTTNDANGGQVMRRTRTKSTIIGVGRPDYIQEETKETVEVTVEMLKKGSKSDNVKALQILLIGYGFDCGEYGADGDFGSATDEAVCKYQKAKGLTVDGIVGEKTWGKLLGV
mgnify:CR=1 FL=1